MSQENTEHSDSQELGQKAELLVREIAGQLECHLLLVLEIRGDSAKCGREGGNASTCGVSVGGKLGYIRLRIEVHPLSFIRDRFSLCVVPSGQRIKLSEHRSISEDIKSGALKRDIPFAKESLLHTDAGASFKLLLLFGCDSARACILCVSLRDNRVTSILIGRGLSGRGRSLGLHKSTTGRDNSAKQASYTSQASG
jgi:hypothetical protein